MLETDAREIAARDRVGKGHAVADPDFEAALQILDEAERCLLALVSREEGKPCPDREAIARWTAGAWWCAQERRDLRPGDRAEAARVRRQWSVFVTRGREELAAGSASGSSRTATAGMGRGAA
mgnify:CR=1 FL=1